jgi:hypothetical protein
LQNAYRAASAISFATADGCETITTCDAPLITTVRLEPASPLAAGGFCVVAAGKDG